MNDLASSHRTYTWKEYLFAPIGCLLSIPPFMALGSLLVIVLTGLYVYYNVNTEIFGIGHPPYDRLQIDNTWEHVALDNMTWTVQYESYTPTHFQGLVRFVGPIRQHGMPFLTHDVLITSGDFANPDLVKTSVINHRFSWFSRELEHPQGTINLLHTVPQKEEIYQQFLALKTGQQVRVTGFEILIIDAYNQAGKRYLWWQDAGCNTLLVTRIESVK